MAGLGLGLHHRSLDSFPDGVDIPCLSKPGRAVSDLVHGGSGLSAWTALSTAAVPPPLAPLLNLAGAALRGFTPLPESVP